MLANRASFTPPTTAASSDQVMQDGAGRLWTSLGQAPALQMAWRGLPTFRSDYDQGQLHRSQPGDRAYSTWCFAKRGNSRAAVPPRMARLSRSFKAALCRMRCPDFVA